MNVDDLTLTRIAENQSTFRTANENIEAAAKDIGLQSGTVPFICECPDRDCTAIVPLDLESYEDVRRYPRRFFAARGHEEISVERGAAVIVDERDGYTLVDKTGIAGDVAEQRFERSGE